MWSYYYAKFQENPCMDTDLSIPLGHTGQRLGYTVSFSETMDFFIAMVITVLKFDCVVIFKQ